MPDNESSWQKNERLNKERNDTMQRAEEKFQEENKVHSTNTCFPSDSKVLTPTGWRRIADIKAGELVLSPDRSGSLAARPVVKRKDHAVGRVLEVHASGQSPLRVTGAHAVLTNRGWVKVAKLCHGERLRVVSGNGTVSYHLVQDVIDTGKAEPVHNLIVRDGTFIVEGCVASSFTCLRWLRVLRLEAWCRLAELLGKRPRELATTARAAA